MIIILFQLGFRQAAWIGLHHQQISGTPGNVKVGWKWHGAATITNADGNVPWWAPGREPQDIVNKISTTEQDCGAYMEGFVITVRCSLEYYFFCQYHA